jgi:hypothetical protein
VAFLGEGAGDVRERGRHDYLAGAGLDECEKAAARREGCVGRDPFAPNLALIVVAADTQRVVELVALEQGGGHKPGIRSMGVELVEGQRIFQVRVELDKILMDRVCDLHEADLHRLDTFNLAKELRPEDRIILKLRPRPHLIVGRRQPERTTCHLEGERRGAMIRRYMLAKISFAKL